MQVGISTASLFPKCNTEQALNVIKSLGVNVAEVFFSTFYEYRPEFAKSILGDVQGLTINSVHVNATNFEPNLFNPSRRVRGDGYYWLDQLGRSAKLLDCKSYTFHGFHRLLGNTGDNYDSMAGYIAEAVEFMAGYGVNLCLENVFWCTYNRPGVFAELKKRVPSLCGVFDIKQARRSDYPWQMYVDEMAGAISYAHLSDVAENGKMCLPGKGKYDFEEIIKRLLGVGFDGNLIVEVYGRDYESFEEVKQSCDFLKEIVYKLKG
jgi:sugar phosphate isomerase/epimerase